MSVQPMRDLSSCWKYYFPGVNDESPRLIKEIGCEHIHLAAFDLLDNYAIVSISSGLSGAWDLRSSVGVVSNTRLSNEFLVVKKFYRLQFRKDFEMGILIPTDCCSSIRIAKTFNHLQDNQSIELFNLNRDRLITQ